MQDDILMLHLSSPLPIHLPALQSVTPEDVLISGLGDKPVWALSEEQVPVKHCREPLLGGKSHCSLLRGEFICLADNSQ